MALPTEQDIRKRFSSLPESIREILNSPAHTDKLREINENLALNDDDSRVLTASVGLVFLGFIKPQELFREINDYLEADEKVVTEAIREINRQVFIPLHKELEDIYKLEGHIEDKLLKEEASPAIVIQPKEERVKEQATKGKISLEALGEEKPRSPVRVGVEGEKPAEGKPLIIHQEESLPAQAEKKPFKGLEFPFGFFGKEGEPAPSEPVKVKIEGPMSRLSQPLIKKEEKRVVHYSELRTPLTPFQKPEEIINLETFGRKQPETKAPMPVAPIKTETAKPAEPPKAAMPGAKPQPKIEGNVVDLSE